jgi:hypothetical protein
MMEGVAKNNGNGFSSRLHPDIPMLSGERSLLVAPCELLKVSIDTG